MINVFFDSHPTLPGHAVRGMGRYAQELEASLMGRETVQLVDRAHADLVHYPFYDLFFLTLPEKTAAPVVVTVHDVIPLLYPKHFPAGIRGKLKFYQQKKRLQSVDAVIVNTETTKKDVVRFLDIPAEKIYSTHFAPNKKYRVLTQKGWRKETKGKYDLPQKFVLYVGDINYHKNIEGLIEAFSRVTDSSVGLVLVGKGFTTQVPEAKQIRELVHIRKLDKRVVMPGFVEDADLVKIHNLASLYCQPSLYEGFGFPVLEAMACGTPVIASKTQALVEIAEGAALFVDTKKPAALAQGFVDLLTKSKLKERLIAQGLERVKQFSWTKTADETVAIYQKILAKK